MPQRNRRHLLLLVMGALAVGNASAQGELLRLDIGKGPGPPEEIAVPRDTVVATTGGAVLAPEALAEALAARRLVIVGEQHTDAAYHNVELRVLELLHKAGARLMLGVEMLPADRAPVLDAWSAGSLSDSEFLAESDWYRVWGYPWGYYRAIFDFARAAGIPIIGLNPAAGESGPGPAAAPAADLDSGAHRALLRAFFETDSPVHGGLSDADFDKLFAAQAERDAAMARRAADALDRYPGRTMVLLAGIGHVLYELGIVRQLPEIYRDTAATVVPVPVKDGTRVTRVSTGIGDYAWGIPEARYPEFPELGVITVGAERGLRVIHVEPDSPAAAAGIETGDVLTRLDGAELAEKGDLNRAMGQAAWGDVIDVALTRGDETLALAVALRR